MSLVSKLQNARKIVALQVEKIRNKPDPFIFVSKDKESNYLLPDKYSSVTEVGELQNAVHLIFPNMVSSAVKSRIVDLKYLNKGDVNAVYVDYERFERFDEYNGRTYFQFLKLE